MSGTSNRLVPCIARQRADGFTMLELLVALAITVAAFTIVWSTFSATVSAWRRGTELLDDMHHGEFVMEQLVSALRSAAFFNTAPDKYGFRMDNASGGDYPAHKLSWVTSGSAFIPPNSPLANGFHRLSVTVERNPDGNAAFAVRAYPHLATISEDEVDPWYISTEVKGIRCRTYNFDEEAWEEQWEDTNSVPLLVEITLYMDPLQKYDDPVTMKRLVEIPVAGAVKKAVKSTQPTSGEAQPAESSQQPSQGTASQEGKATISPNP